MRLRQMREHYIFAHICANMFIYAEYADMRIGKKGHMANSNPDLYRQPLAAGGDGIEEES